MKKFTNKFQWVDAVLTLPTIVAIIYTLIA